ncbi:MAG: EAL domain-containing protein [Clostridia bacterium]|nr:EAL domain-containing protein [Clostridia bacterium]
MKQFQTTYCGETALRAVAAEWIARRDAGAALIHLFSDGAEESTIAEARAVIEEMMPEAVYVGSSASGCIYNGGVSAEKLVISCTVFEKPDSFANSRFFPIEKGDLTSFREDLRKCMADLQNVKGIEVITTIDTVPIREVCGIIQQELPEEIPVWGGGAFGDNTFNAFLFTKGEPLHTAGILMTFIGGSDIHVRYAYVSGWKPLGYPMKVTRASGYVVNELDGNPAFQIYQHYLKIPNDDHIFYNALEFPFAVESNGRTLLRHALSCDENGALTMSTGIPEGSVLHMTYGDPETIMQDVMQCAQTIGEFSPEVISVFDCFGRKSFWGGTDAATREIIPFNRIAPTYGFCTSGELIRWEGSMDHHNLTLVMAGMREGDGEQKTAVVRREAGINESTTSMTSRLVNFINTATAEVIEANATLSRMAVTDQLTKLYNRGEIQRRITERVGEKKDKPEGVDATSLVMFDLDDYKKINDTCGHQEGDQVLRRVSALVLGMTQKSEGAAAGRWGGEEFMIMLPGITGEDAATFAEELRVEIGRLRFEKAGRITASFGVAQAMPGEEPDPLTARADTALYRAKARGKNTVCRAEGIPDEEIRAEQLAEEIPEGRRIRNEEQYILANIGRAIREKWIHVYYQPIVRAVTEKICDEEALARWLDPVRGLLPPSEFVPYLEKAGQIYKLDLYVVEQVLEKLQTMRAMGIDPVKQSINLSRADFEACDIVEEIRKRVDASGIGRDMITIEITESIIGSSFEFMKEQIGRFSALGFPVWMDDFGSGYSSLDVLQSIRFDLIKFDKSFMKKLDEGEAGKIILTDLMRMATSLGVDTVCEGVETEEQARFLQEIGCSKLQGYYYGRPTSVKELKERYYSERRVGFEDPAASAYFDAIGRVNLYDLNVIASQDEDSIRKTFNTLPMAIIEVKGDAARYVRTNPSYRTFVRRIFRLNMPPAEKEYVKYESSFMRNIIRTCLEQGQIFFFSEKMPDGSVVHSFSRRIGTNPVTGDTAVVIGVLSISDSGNEESYADLARALASDYHKIYVVDLDNEDYTEYTSPAGGDNLAIERQGNGFFEKAVGDTTRRISADDRDRFLRWFTKENLEEEAGKQEVATNSFRLMDKNSKMRVSMKVTRMQGTNRIILGVSIIDSGT